MCENEVADECVVVGYAVSSSDREKLARRLYRISLACGIVPLGFGILTTVAFVLTKASIFVETGMFLLFVGVVATVVCGICLLWYGLVAFLNRVERGRRILAKCFVAGLLMALNYPVAFLCADVWLWRVSRSTIVIENNTNALIENIRLKGLSQTTELGDLPPGGRIKEVYSQSFERSLDILVRIGSKETVVNVEPYLGRAKGVDKKVVFSPGGKIDVFDR